MSLEKVANLITTNKGFVKCLQEDVEATLVRFNVQLDDEEIEALENLLSSGCAIDLVSSPDGDKVTLSAVPWISSPENQKI